MQNAKKLFVRSNSHPLVLSAALFEAFGPEWVGWDVDSLYLAIKKEFSADTSKKNQARINALSVIYSNHSYWEDWRAFEVISWSLSGRVVDTSILNPVTDLVAVYGKTIVDLIDPNTKFSEPTSKYIVASFLHEQYSLLPPQFSELQRFLDLERPDLIRRASKVKELLKDSKLGRGSKKSMEDRSPEEVEALKHVVLQHTNDMINSKKYVLSQAEFFGLKDQLKKAYR